MILFLILGLIIGAVSVVFVLQNITPITVTFFVWQISGSLSVILLVALLAGMLVSVLVLLPSFIKAEWKLGRLEKKNKKLADAADVQNSQEALRATQPMPVQNDPIVDL
jgi:uncharacterized integral membrane protein